MTTNFPLRSVFDKPLPKLKPVGLKYTVHDPIPLAITDSPIFLLHGFLACRHQWASIAQEIARKVNRRVITVDLRNHGDSPHTDELSYELMATDMIKLMETLKAINGKASLIGHSLGGRTAMAVAFQRPDLVNDLILIDLAPVGRIADHEYWQDIIEHALDVDVPKHLNLKDGRVFLLNELKYKIGSRFIWENLIPCLLKSGEKFYWKMNLKAIKHNFKQLVENPTFEKCFDKPTLFICGGLTKPRFFAHKEDIQKIFPKAEYRLIRHADHNVHIDDPYKFLKAVCDFFYSHD